MFVVFSTSGAADGTPGTKSEMVVVSVKATDSFSIRIHAVLIRKYLYLSGGTEKKFKST